MKQHNKQCADNPIHTVLCPGLGTAVGRMPYKRCAVQVYPFTARNHHIAGYIYWCSCCPQMRMAYEAVMFRDVEAINYPPSLHECCSSHLHLTSVSATTVPPSFPLSRIYFPTTLRLVNSQGQGLLLNHSRVSSGYHHELAQKN